MNTPLLIKVRPSTQDITAATTTGTGVKLMDSCSEVVALLDISAIGDLTQATDTLDVYIDASHDGVVWFNVGRFLRITGVDSVYATGTLTSTGAITSGVHAESVLTVTGGGNQIADGYTVTIGSTVYTFKTTLTTGGSVAYEVLIGATDTIALANLRKAVNATGVAGTDYGTGTAVHPTVVASASNATTMSVKARTPGVAANTIATTKSGAEISWPDTTLGGGTGASNPGVAGETVTIGAKTYMWVDVLSETNGATAIVNQVLYGSSVTTAFANLKKAVNAEAGVGTNYSTGTTANATASVTATDATTVSVSAITIGPDGNAVVTTETMANGAFGAVTLTGGTYGAGVVARQALKWSSAILESSQPVSLIADISSSSGGIRQVGVGAYVRYRGVIAGSEPDFTYSVTLVAKK